MRLKHSFLALTCLALLSLAISGCSSRTVMRGEEISASNESANWLINRYGAVTDRDVMRYLASVADRLARSIDAIPARNDVDQTINSLRAWQFIILNTNEPNAFSVGSGIVFLTKGFVQSCHTEATLAAVLAHEMSHELLGHTSQLIADSSSEDGAPRYHFRYDQELQADQLSLQILKYAHYDTRYALTALTIAYRPDSRIVSSHDSYLDYRVAALEQAIAEMGVWLPATSTTREFAKLQESLGRYVR